MKYSKDILLLMIDETLNELEDCKDTLECRGENNCYWDNEAKAILENTKKEEFIEEPKNNSKFKDGDIVTVVNHYNGWADNLIGIVIGPYIFGSDLSKMSINKALRFEVRYATEQENNIFVRDFLSEWKEPKESLDTDEEPKEFCDEYAKEAANIWCRCFKCDGIVNETGLKCDKTRLLTCPKWYDSYKASLIALETYNRKLKENKEPKFKVGDWICNGGGTPCYVESMFENYYELASCCGYHYTKHSKDVEDNYYLWTIEDAKDGDVLCYKDEISLYNHDIKNCTKQETTFGGFVYHCCYDGKRFIMDSLYSLTEQDKINIHPATKEQRELLFKKMKESGYEWDDEKKELKQLSQSKVTKISEQVWSEEDEHRVEDTIYFLETAKKHYASDVELNACIDWLKLLKDRI